jgi:predicted RecA/RadA family phage recombinase
MKKMIIMAGIAMLAFAVYAAQNFVHASGYVSYTNPGAAISSGELVDLGNIYGVALNDIASNSTETVRTDGVWKFERATTNAVSFGDALYYSSATTVTESATADKYIGVCVEAVEVTTSTSGQYIKLELNADQRQKIVGTDVSEQ